MESTATETDRMDAMQRGLAVGPLVTGKRSASAAQLQEESGARERESGREERQRNGSITSQLSDASAVLLPLAEESETLEREKIVMEATAAMDEGRDKERDRASEAEEEERKSGAIEERKGKGRRRRRRHEDYQIPRMTLRRRQEQLCKEGRTVEAAFFAEAAEVGRIYCRLCSCTVGIDSKRFKGHLQSNKHRLAFALKRSNTSAPEPSSTSVPSSASASVSDASSLSHSPVTALPMPSTNFLPMSPSSLGVRSAPTSEALASLIKATDFAARKHIDGRRKGNQSPYINHPLGVANMISEVGGVSRLEILQAAVLHDTVEDTNTSLQEIKVLFGAEVASIVAEVTDDKSMSKVDRKRCQVLHASHCSYEARLVKLADTLYNLRDLARHPPPTWSIARIQGYCVWAKAVTSQMLGTNLALEAQLELLMASRIEVPPRGEQSDPQVVPFLPPGNLANALEQYYHSLMDVDD